MMICRTFVCFILVECLFPIFLFGQSKKVQSMQRQKKEMQQQLSRSRKALDATQKDLRLKLRDIDMLTNQVENRQRYIDSVTLQIALIEKQADSLEHVVKQTRQELSMKKADYAKSLRYARIQKTIESPLLFVLSTETVSQMYRRARYAREYANYQRILAEQIQTKQQELMAQKNDLLDAKAEKNRLMLECLEQKQLLEKQQEQEARQAATLKRQQQEMFEEVTLQQQQLQALDRQIDEWIAHEMEQTRKREEEERKKEQTRLQTEAKGKKQDTKSAAVASGNISQNDGWKVAEDRNLTGGFEKNKGNLPVPITGSYMIGSRFGLYHVQGLKNVQLDNKGTNFVGRAGAMARAVFDGEVSAVFQYAGSYNVLVRHGNYISVYCNLSSVRVRKGQRIRTKDILGVVEPDDSGSCVLHFQLRKETVKLNPEHWIGT